MAVRVQCGTKLAYVISTRVSTQNTVTILNSLTQSLLHMVQHDADWIAPFPRSQHSPPPPHKLLHIPPSFFPLCA